MGGGHLVRSLPFIAAVYASMLLAWTGAVGRLDKLHVVDFGQDDEGREQEPALEPQPGPARAA